ncbi:MAG: SDR family NAD(P)-dependent oxidoreductase [Nanoarchaeota archaeon]
MKKAIITGASSGLGLEIGKLLQKEGIDIVNLSRNKSSFENVVVNLADDKQVLNVIELIKKKHSDFDVLVLNAGIMPDAALGAIDFDIDNLFQINISASIKLVNGLLPLIKKNHCDIVVVGSTSSFNHFPGNGAYTATKYAVLGFIKALQTELKQDDVRVIGFHPGGFNSNLRGHGVFKEGYMDPKYLASLLLSLLRLPRNMEVSEIIINRRKPKG